MSNYVERSQHSSKQSKAYWRSRKQEKEIATNLGGYAVPQSGAGKRKGDVRVNSKVLIECKCTEKKSFSITQEMLDKIESAALNNDELPVIAVEFMGDIKRTVAVVPMWVIEALVESRNG